jgi:ABC-type dipeptide/oligopeptide/nickel transport system ATPase component
MTYPVLEVKDLRVYYRTPQRVIRAVDGISLDIAPGERFGLVGESGSGKSTIAMAILRLIKPPGKIESGTILLCGTEGERSNGEAKQVDLLSLTEEQMRRLRLASIALIGQGAMNSLNPVARIRIQILDGLRDHGVHLSRREQRRRVGELLESVGLSPQVADMYPHELSGGMKQRVVIAIAISLRPRLIIADEPTSALDVIVQRQVVETLCQVQERLRASVLMVGHDMGLMAQSVHRLGVMYAGKMVEVGSVQEIFSRPQHSYTRMLIASLPSLTTKGLLSVTRGESQ